MSEELVSKEITIFKVSNQLFAIDSGFVKSIVTERAISQLPFVPDYIEGLVNIEESIAPLMNFSAILGLNAEKTNLKDQLLVINNEGSLLVLRINEVIFSGSMSVEISNNQKAEDQDENDDLYRLFSHRFLFENTNVLVIDPSELGALVHDKELEDINPGVLGKSESQKINLVTENNSLIFTVANENFIFNLEEIVEVIDYESLSPVPGAPKELSGVIVVRDEVLVVLSLARILGKEQVSRQKGTLIVVEYAGRRYGLEIDKFVGIKKYKESQVRKLENMESGIYGVLVDGATSYSLLTPSRIITHERRERLAPFVPAYKKESEKHEERFYTILEIKLGDESYGLSIDKIFGISELKAIEKISSHDSESHMVSGAVNIKGEIIPVVDYAEALGHSASTSITLEKGIIDKRALIIVGNEKNRWAVPVSGVSQIISLPESEVENMEVNDNQFVSAVANFNDRLISIISIDALEV